MSHYSVLPPYVLMGGGEAPWTTWVPRALSSTYIQSQRARSPDTVSFTDIHVHCPFTDFSKRPIRSDSFSGLPMARILRMTLEEAKERVMNLAALVADHGASCLTTLLDRHFEDNGCSAERDALHRLIVCCCMVRTFVRRATSKEEVVEYARWLRDTHYVIDEIFEGAERDSVVDVSSENDEEQSESDPDI